MLPKNQLMQPHNINFENDKARPPHERSISEIIIALFVYTQWF